MNQVFNNIDLCQLIISNINYSNLILLNLSIDNEFNNEQGCIKESLSFEIFINCLKEKILKYKRKHIFLIKLHHYSKFKYSFQHFKHLSFLYQLPLINFKPSFLGPTDYIDGIEVNDLNSSLMRGLDCYQRHYIVLKYKILESIKINGIFFETNKIYLLTIFQRYSDSVKSWTKAGSYQGPILEDTLISLRHDQKKMFIDRLVSIIKYQQCDIKCYESLSSNVYQIKTLKVNLNLI